MKKTSYIEAITEALYEEMERDERVFLIGEDIGIYGGVFKATKGLLDRANKMQKCQLFVRVGPPGSLVPVDILDNEHQKTFPTNLLFD